MKYLIRETDGSFVERSPTIGKWYAGFSADGEGRCTFFGPEGYGKKLYRDGILAEYFGMNEFYTEGSDEPSDMTVYDFLAEQA